MDFDNMTKDELLDVLKESYMKLIRPIPHSPTFKVGNYYMGEQTDDDEIEIYGDEITLYLTFNEADKYFRE